MPTAVWIVMGVIILAAISGSRRKGRKSVDSKGQPFRIDHPHVISGDESECSVCGKRFRGKRSACPACGVRFENSKVDDEEFDEEEDELEAWEEEED